MEVCGDGQAEADEDEEGGDGVYDEDAGEGMADVGGEGEVAGVVEDGDCSVRGQYARSREGGEHEARHVREPYPMEILEHTLVLVSHTPNTPKLYPSKLASGMALMTGVDRVLSRRMTKAAKKTMASGVAGRSIVGTQALCRRVQTKEWGGWWAPCRWRGPVV